jgi:hypothetical protein
MSEPEKEDDRRYQEEFKNLCYFMGLSLVMWQQVEEEHFRLFVKMLGAPQKEICSIVYYSTESFRCP